jgi:hypothetical protein
MPLNLIKKYNDLLDLGAYNDYQRKQSLLAIFDRDIATNDSFTFNGKKITPTPQTDGQIKMELLFFHLTTVVEDRIKKNRIFDHHRSIRLHWVKYHIDFKKKENMLHFSIKEPEGIRTYIYDKDEKYVIILEPLRNGTEYYLITAYHLRGKDAKRNKIVKKYKRKLDEIY